MLVTGAGGFVGGHVVKALIAAGHHPRALLRPSSDGSALEQAGIEVRRGDLLDETSLHRAARGADGLVHCAARLGAWSRQDEMQRRINVEGTAAILRVALQRKIARVVHVSSVVAVGLRREPVPLTEEEPWMGRAAPRINYVLTKFEAEQRVKVALAAGLAATIVNPAAMVGPHAYGPSKGGMVAAAREGRLKRLHPGGSSFAHVADVATGCVQALERGRVGERYLLGGENVTWLEVCRRAARQAGAPEPRGTWPLLAGRGLALAAGLLDAVHLSRPPWAPERYRMWGWYTFADSSKAVAELGYAPRDLDAALADSGA